MKKYLQISFVLSLVMAVTMSFAQERTVSGKVTAVDDGSALPGVNVVVKGTTTGTVTDVDGNYKLVIPSENSTLVFSFIGLATEQVVVGSRSVIDVQMTSDVTQLSEVVVTAFGVEREEKALGYAVQSVDGSELTKAREPNVVNSLAGKIAGVQITNGSGAVGSSSRIVLRGASSITGNNQPLFVVDGVPISNTTPGNSSPFGGTDFGNGAADVNPDDIETITVLKGPNAAALYGSRASNGVILITTKSGKGSQGIGLSVNSSTQFERPLKLPDFQNSYGQGASSDYFQWIDGSAGDGGVDESWGPPLDVGLDFVQWTSNGEYPEPWVSQPDNVKDFFETGVTLTNNVSLTGANDNGNFRLSITNLDQTGTLPNTDYSRQNYSMNAGYNLTNKLRGDFSANYVRGHSDNRPSLGYTGQNPIQQFIWSGRNVDFAALENYKDLPISTAGLGAGISPVNWNTRFQNNPYWASDNIINSLDRDRVFGNLRISYKINDNLSVFARTGIDYYTDEQTRIRAQGVESTTNGNGFFSKLASTREEINSDFLISFNKAISENFHLTLNAGGNQLRQRLKQLSGTAPELELPGVYNLSNVKSGVNVLTSDFSTNKRINSLYGSGQFAFKNYLFLDFTARNDWSSTLPEDNNSYFYPSVTLSAVISDILAIDSDLLSFLKIRGGWAQVGSDTSPYQLTQTFAFGSSWGSILEPTEGDRLLNPELKPEITTSFEAGLDARFLDGRILLDVTYYDSKSSDQIIPIQITGASGYLSRNANIGEISNKGIELQLSGDVVRKGDFGWNMALNFARNVNEVVELAPGLDQLTLGGQWNVNVEARVGQPYGALFGPAFKRSPDGDIIHDKGLPETDETFQVIGNVTPQWTGGINNTFTFKGVLLNVLIDGKYGGDMYSMTTTWGRYSGVLEETIFGRETGIVGVGVIDNGDGTFSENDVIVPAEDYNKAAYSNSIAESSIFDATYFKLRQVQLGYTLPNSVIGKLPFRDVTVSVVGRNLALLYSTVPHVDPESAFSSSNGNQGLEFGQIPSNRSLGFNISFKL